MSFQWCSGQNMKRYDCRDAKKNLTECHEMESNPSNDRATCIHEGWSFVLKWSYDILFLLTVEFICIFSRKCRSTYSYWAAETLGDLQLTSRGLDPGVKYKKSHDINFDAPDAHSTIYVSQAKTKWAAKCYDCKTLHKAHLIWIRKIGATQYIKNYTSSCTLNYTTYCTTTYQAEYTFSTYIYTLTVLLALTMLTIHWILNMCISSLITYLPLYQVDITHRRILS
jgi:hypothetical protein